MPRKHCDVCSFSFVDEAGTAHTPVARPRVRLPNFGLRKARFLDEPQHTFALSRNFAFVIKKHAPHHRREPRRGLAQLLAVTEPSRWGGGGDPELSSSLVMPRASSFLCKFGVCFPGRRRSLGAAQYANERLAT